MTGPAIPVCEATVILLDDRWGAVKDRCELSAGHRGEHAIVMGATIPLAQLRWPQDNAGAL